MTGNVVGEKHPTLYLLHGLSDDHTIWGRRTSIERYVAELGLAVVMPAVHRSFYTDMVRGDGNYWSFISEELPAIARSFFPLSDKREDNYVAGLSMGGYGAFKLALRKPESFAAAASLSGALDLRQRLANPEGISDEIRSIFGEAGSQQRVFGDLMDASQGVVDSGALRPKLYAACGLDDFLLEENRSFAQHMKQINYDLHYEEDAGYNHSWGYWDLTIQRVLKWLPLKANTAC